MDHMNGGVAKSLDQYFDPLDKKLQEFFVTKAPFDLPNGLKEFMVTVFPYFNALSVALTAMSLLAWVGLSSIFGPVMKMANVNLNMNINGIGAPILVLQVVSLVLSILAFGGLFKRHQKAWKYKVWQALIGALMSAIMLNVYSLLIGGLVSLYLLYQIKSKYTN
jgi:uncharacterized BrkB/YihY/UPF0761 family membrane protein